MATSSVMSTPLPPVAEPRAATAGGAPASTRLAATVTITKVRCRVVIRRLLLGIVIAPVAGQGPASQNMTCGRRAEMARSLGSCAVGIYQQAADT
jgi:hypothetical protein